MRMYVNRKELEEIAGGQERSEERRVHKERARMFTAFVMLRRQVGVELTLNVPFMNQTQRVPRRE
jgi:hypothetical protein